jgi:hypothetical protein
MQVVAIVADVWVLAWIVVNKAYTREFWVSMNRPISDVVRTATPSRSAQVISFGMFVLVALDTLVRFF